MSGPEWTILKLVKWTADYFRSYDIEGPRIEAELLLAHALGVRRIDLYLRYDQPLNGNELAVFKPLIQRRAAREPAAYILGTKEFWSMEMKVDRSVLIPRPETECLVETTLAFMAAELGPETKRILDLGTGSGAIALALASQQPAHAYFASDVSVSAIRTSRFNAIRHNLEDKIHFFCSDWFSALKDRRQHFDIIVSNPPYIETAVLRTLQPEIYKYEPCYALDGGIDGLACLRLIVQNALAFMPPDGRLFLEIGHNQKDALKGIAAQSGGYDQVICIKDYSGYDRVVEMRKK